MKNPTYQINGGNLKEHGLEPPHKRKFDDRRRRRKVLVTITGYTCGGLHYYVTIDEERNPILGTNEKGEPAWINAWDDKDNKGEYHSKRCNTVGDAERYIKKMLKKYPKKTHQHNIRNYAPQNIYVKEGD